MMANGPCEKCGQRPHSWFTSEGYLCSPCAETLAAQAKAGAQAYEDDLRRKLRSILHEVDTGGPCKDWPQALDPNQESYCVGCEIGNLVQGAMLDLDEMLNRAGGGREKREVR